MNIIMNTLAALVAIILVAARVFESDDNGETVEENEVTAVFYEGDDCGARWTI